MPKEEKPQTNPLLGEFPWGRLAQPQLTAGQIADKARRALRRLQEWKVRVPPRNRLERAGDLVEAAGASDSRSWPEEKFVLVADAARTALDLYLATHSDDVRPEVLALEKLEAALGGGDTITQTGGTYARDIQFELVVWGTLRVGGIPVRLMEPDLRFELEGEDLGIAVKRIWSLDQAKGQLSKAAEQILRTGRRGMIATNVQQYLVPQTAVGDLQEKGTAFNLDVRRLHGHLPYLMGKQHVIGLWLSGAAVAPGEKRSTGPRRADLSTFNQIVWFADESERAKFEKLARELGEKMRDWYRDYL